MHAVETPGDGVAAHCAAGSPMKKAPWCTPKIERMATSETATGVGSPTDFESGSGP
jgi:hypothetical protein